MPTSWCKFINEMSHISAPIPGIGLPISYTRSAHRIAAKKQEQWIPSVRYSENLDKNTIYAENGDIIVCRVGKSAGQWCVYSGDRVAISDCLFCIKDPNGTVKMRIKGMRYNIALRGVSVRYITKNDILEWYDGKASTGNFT